MDIYYQHATRISHQSSINPNFIHFPHNPKSQSIETHLRGDDDGVEKQDEDDEKIKLGQNLGACKVGFELEPKWKLSPFFLFPCFPFSLLLPKSVLFCSQKQCQHYIT